jgi:hypothetical protein
MAGSVARGRKNSPTGRWSLVASLSATQRTLRALRERGLVCDIVERWIQRPGFGFRKDLFGIIDLIALGPEGVIGVQSCSTDLAAHLKKITEDCYESTVNWLRTPGCTLELWGWRKLKVKRGGKAMTWAPRVITFGLDNGKLVWEEK